MKTFGETPSPQHFLFLTKTRTKVAWEWTGYYVYLPSALFQFSCNTCSRHLTGAWELRKLSFKLSLLNSHATLVLVWPGHENWENSHANSHFSTLMQPLFSFARGMRIEKTLIQTLASQLSCNSCSRLTWAWHLRQLSCKLSPLNSHATLVLVWPGHENWENSHANPRFSTLTNVWAGLTIIIYLLAVIDYNRNNKHVWAEEHKDVTLSCDINGYPAPVFSWVKNKTVVATGSSSLTLLHVKQNESCTYECWGNNTLGYNAMLVELRVASKLHWNE
jgi:hypothetical protein